MPDLIYRGFGQHGQGLLQLLQSQFRLSGRVIGNDIVIGEQDVSRVFPFSNVLQRHAQGRLSEDRDVETARQMAAQVRVAQPNLGPLQVRIPDGFGLLTRAVEATDRLATAAPDGVAEVLTNYVLPFLRELQASHVTAVTVDAHRAQTMLSFVKILCLVQQFGVASAQQMLSIGQQNRDVEPLGGALPNPFDLLAFVDTLMRFPPLVLTLTVCRLDCAWHFQGRAMWNFHRALSNSFLTELGGYKLDPLATDSHLFGLNGLEGMDEANVWRYLSLIVSGVDRLFGWLGDPRNFQQSDGTVNLLRQVQGFSAVHLLFADLAGLHTETRSHNRIS